MSGASAVGGVAVGWCACARGPWAAAPCPGGSRRRPARGSGPRRAALKMRTASPSSMLARARVVGMHQQAHLGPRQLGQRRGDRAFAGGRDQRERVIGGGRIGLIAVEPRGRLGVQRLGKQVDLAVGRPRKHVHELDRPAAVGRRRGAVGAQLGAGGIRHPRQHVEHFLQLADRVAVLLQIQPLQQLAEHVRVAARFAHRLDHGLAEPQADRAVAARAGRSPRGTSSPAAPRRRSAPCRSCV